MDEEERAALYREQLAARRQARRNRFVGLAGNRSARVALDAAWLPVLLTSLESQMAYAAEDDYDSEEELIVEVPQEDIYITEIPDGLLL